MNGYRQTGGALILVILLLALSSVMLNTTRKQLDAGLGRVADERVFLQQTSLAWSALRWGARQSWSSRPEWQCKHSLAEGWRSCLGAAEEGRELLRGDSGQGSISLYQWVTRRADNDQIKPLPHGWIDYCPLADEAWCNPDEATARF